MTTPTLYDPADAIAQIQDLVGDKVFGAEFTKKDGTVRTGSFRLKVTKDLTGAGSSYDRTARGHLTVYDMNKRGYRTIRLESLRRITCGGRTINLTPPEEG